MNGIDGHDVSPLAGETTMSDNPTIVNNAASEYSTLEQNIFATGACAADRGSNVVYLRDIRGSKWGRLDQAKQVKPHLAAHAAPEFEQGEFVGIIHELAKLWHINLVRAPFYPIQASLKLVSDAD